MAKTFSTIGHSNRSLDEFVTMLEQAQIDLLVDVRSFPRSRSNPAFNIDTLPDDLARLNIDYCHCPALGGRRSRQVDVDRRVNDMWRSPSFHNYADYALSPTFGAAYDKLVAWGTKQRVAIMCAEAVWWRCHRRIITDYLLLDGHAVEHLMGPRQTSPAKLTRGAQKTSSGKVIYPAQNSDVVTEKDTEG